MVLGQQQSPGDPLQHASAGTARASLSFPRAAMYPYKALYVMAGAADARMTAS